jgi:hypothetical protein
MTLRPQALPPVPDATAAAGQTAFPKSSRVVLFLASPKGGVEVQYTDRLSLLMR